MYYAGRNLKYLGCAREHIYSIRCYCYCSLLSEWCQDLSHLLLRPFFSSHCMQQLRVENSWLVDNWYLSVAWPSSAAVASSQAM